LYIPLWKSFAGIGASVLCKGKNLTIDEDSAEEIEDYIDKENQPTKKEMKKFLAEAIEVLKHHKGLELVEVEDAEGTHVKITL
jgi:guanylate kinase